MGSQAIKVVDQLRAQWYWKSNSDSWSTNGNEEWTKYADIESAIIEEAFNRQNKTKLAELENYSINLNDCIQISKSDPNEQRQIKRVLTSRNESQGLREERFFLPPALSKTFNDDHAASCLSQLLKTSPSSDEHSCDETEMAPGGMQHLGDRRTGQLYNGIWDCENGAGEERCFELELNECNPDTHYRCHSGQCIIKSFSFDHIYDCMDYSDEQGSDFLDIKSKPCHKLSTIECEEYNCAWLKFSCLDGQCIRNSEDHFCESPREVLYNRQKIFRKSNDDLTELCWKYMMCITDAITSWRVLFTGTQIIFSSCTQYHLSALNLFHCNNSNKYISKYRVNNGFDDWDLYQDEKYSNTCGLNLKNDQFECFAGEQCFSRVKFLDTIENCDDKSDEPFRFNCLLAPDENNLACELIRNLKKTLPTYFLFQDLCDDLIFRNIPIDNETDETKCDLWPCNSRSKTCNGFWNCPNVIHYQSERVTIFLEFVIPSNKFEHLTLFRLMTYLLDENNTILNTEQVVHSPYIQPGYKHIFYLIYPRNHSIIVGEKKNVKIDAYSVTQTNIDYQSSWYESIQFPFLPVNRLTMKLTLRDKILCGGKEGKRSCIHGRCVKYTNSPKTFCLCNDGWTGAQCNEEWLLSYCNCSKYSKCIEDGKCLCPIGFICITCHIRYNPCKNVTCNNNDTCLPLDQRSLKFVCICQKNYFVVNREHQNAVLTLNPSSLIYQDVAAAIIIHFVKVNLRIGFMEHEDRFLYKNSELNYQSFQICFYDEIYQCFCYNNFQPDYLVFNHHVNNCTTDTAVYCQNDARCLQANRQSIYYFTCLYSLEIKGLIQTFVFIVVVVLTISSFIANLISITTFCQPKPREVGCGLYLLTLSIISQLDIFIFGLRFISLLLNQFTFISCILLEFLLPVIPSIFDWLTALIAIERAITVIKEANFNKKKSYELAKYIIICIFITIPLSSLHKPFHCNLTI
ncbi:unnamed protein product [Didymodactylos carnosus]|uniref:WWE domain-containing protein n=1 Tax=Didymodactylos carnosus TaxID=1234261 RepID=A0A814NIW9_9BILA|nr:unnamed protein product [Didymodactylos carnosus]CAF3856586.1 unnamed protein product [Didymodactylos carnosus]